MEDSLDKLLTTWTEICLRLPGAAAAIASSIYGFRLFKAIVAGEPFAIALAAFIFWAALSFSFFKFGELAVSRLAQKSKGKS